jgi:hypothetical protein
MPSLPACPPVPRHSPTLRDSPRRGEAKVNPGLRRGARSDPERVSLSQALSVVSDRRERTEESASAVAVAFTVPRALALYRRDKLARSARSLSIAS